MSGAIAGKIRRDLAQARGRSILAALAMAAGVFEVTAMLYTYALLQPALGDMYEKTSPSSATLVTDAVDDTLVAWVRAVAGVGAAEARPLVIARARVGEEWVPAVLYVVRDFDRQSLDTFLPDRGAWPPASDEVLLERTALPVAAVKPGGSLTLRTAGREDVTVRVAGTAYAAGLAPAWMEHMVPGFIAWDSPLRGGDSESSQIRFTVAEHARDEGHIREVADSVCAMLERRGHAVSRVTVPPPGRHPHAGQMEAFLFLLLSFGVLSFLLSAVLVTAMVQALMAEQVRQIGVMKAIGARDAQVALIYLGEVGALAAAALLIGVPPGLLAGRAYAQFASGILNASWVTGPGPLWVLGVVIPLGIGLPLLAAWLPVRRSARITVREALDDAPAAPRPPGDGTGGEWLPRPLRLSLRAALARRGRLALTLALMAVGGAAFVSALNVAAGWRLAVEEDFARRRYDLTASFVERQPIAAVRSALAGVEAVERVEFWPGASPYLIGRAGVPTQTITVLGPDPGSTLLAPAVQSGRWLDAGVSGGVVVNQAVVARHGALAVGDTLRVRLRGREAAWPVAGVVRELMPMPVAYVRPEAVRALGDFPADRTRSARIVTRGHDVAGQRAAARRVEEAFERAGIELSGLQRTTDARQGILDHLVIIFSVLGAASLVVVFVGGLGLASALTLSVIQRTREIGVLGAIGASPSVIARQVWLESLSIGLASWVLSLILAVPVSALLETVCGRIFLEAPLPFHFSPAAAALWLAAVVILSTVASLSPARRAARLTIREALSFA